MRSTPMALLVLLSAVLAGSGPPVPAGEVSSARAERSWLGVWLGDTVDGGVEVVAVVPGGPCEQAGVRVGDVILQVNDVELTERSTLGGLLGEVPPGEPLRLVVMRSGEPVEALVRTAARPAAIAPVPSPPAPVPHAPPRPRRPEVGFRVQSRVPRELLGLKLASVTPALRRHYGAPADAGVLVTSVAEGKLGALAGVKVGDVLVTLDARTIVRPEQVESTLLTWDGEDPLRATLIRAGERLDVVLVAGVRFSSGEESGSITKEVAAARRAWAREQRELERKRIDLEIEQLRRRLAELERRLRELQDEP